MTRIFLVRRSDKGKYTWYDTRRVDDQDTANNLLNRGYKEVTQQQFRSYKNKYTPERLATITRQHKEGRVTQVKEHIIETSDRGKVYVESLTGNVVTSKQAPAQTYYTTGDGLQYLSQRSARESIILKYQSQLEQEIPATISEKRGMAAQQLYGIKEETVQAYQPRSQEFSAMTQAGYGSSPELLFGGKPVNVKGTGVGYEQVTVPKSQATQLKKENVSYLPYVEKPTKLGVWSSKINKPLRAKTQWVAGKLFDLDYQGYSSYARSNKLYMFLQGAEKQVVKDVANKPVTTGGLYVVGGIAGAGSRYLSIRAATNITKGNYVRAFLQANVPKAAGVIVSGAYFGGRTQQIVNAPTYEAKGRIFGSTALETAVMAKGFKFGSQGVQNVYDYKAAQRAARFDDSLKLMSSKYLYGSGKAWQQQGSLGTKYYHQGVSEISLDKYGRATLTVDTYKGRTVPKGSMALNPTGRGEYQLPLDGSVKNIQQGTIKIRSPGRATFDTYSTKQTFTMQEFKVKASQFYKYDMYPKLTDYGINQPVGSSQQSYISSRGLAYSPFQKSTQTTLTMFKSTSQPTQFTPPKSRNILWPFTNKKASFGGAYSPSLTVGTGMINVPKYTTIFGNKVSRPLAGGYKSSIGGVYDTGTIFVGVYRTKPTYYTPYTPIRTLTIYTTPFKTKRRQREKRSYVNIGDETTIVPRQTQPQPVALITPQITGTQSKPSTKTREKTVVVPDIINPVVPVTPPIRPRYIPRDLTPDNPPPPPPTSIIGRLPPPYYPKGMSTPQGGGSTFKPSYMPSIEALFLGITGKKPKEEELRMGLNLRPILR